jgi:hypothetical protein
MKTLSMQEGLTIADLPFEMPFFNQKHVIFISKDDMSFYGVSPWLTMIDKTCIEADSGGISQGCGHDDENLDIKLVPIAGDLNLL